MKILAIRGKNLASLEGEFNIDFTTEPLRSAGIFAITGPTGAGKSTILDALCLALFDSAPRLIKAESVKKEDLESLNDKISLNDSRNILRKGVAEGYAEVDFVALNGDQYRSRWSVRRARGKSDGALQASTLRLDNLSTETEEQGTKRDLLSRVSEVIGLTFDQFTRAVLLAQGDFSTFLKAKQNEKAELLEKLTGTEVYSKISTLIFQRTGEAKIALDMLKQRMADVKLLTDEELETLNKEKKENKEKTEPLRNQSVALEKKLSWIKQEEELKQEISQAESDLKTIQTKIQEAVSRYQYMSMIDVSQEIRDSYINLEREQKQKTELTTSLQNKEEQAQAVLVRFNKIDVELKVIKTQLDEGEQKFNALKPEIAKAKELDIKIEASKEKGAEMRKEIDAQKKLLAATDQNISNLQTQIKDSKQVKDILSKWFDDNALYKEIVPRIDLILTLLNNAQSANKQRISASSSLDSNSAILKTYMDLLKQQEEESERLNALLPAEIIHLREKLEEGKPCAVCGSIHHPLRDNKEQEINVNEQELESAKKRVAEELSKTKENIENTRRNITEFTVHVKNFQYQYDNAISDCKEYLWELSDWEIRFSQDVLQNELRTKTNQWNENKGELDKSIQLLENLVVRIEGENKARATLKNDLETKTKAIEAQRIKFNDYIKERSLLLGNKSVEEIETFYTSSKEELSTKHESLRTTKDKIETEKATITGTIVQLKKDAAVNSEQVVKLDTEVQNWINSDKHQITIETLIDLMSKSREWIAQEKSYLSDIENQRLVLSTTLKERNIRLAKHLESEDKPDENQNEETLTLQSKEVGENLQTINKRLTEIEVGLAAHHNGKKQIAAFENELKAKDERHNNWAKLNELLGSAKGDKFKTIAQGYTLDVLLNYANKHLEDLTKRYTLEKIPNSLALQVIDNDMLGEVRTVHSLSGGESFLISLSLALGLSSLSSNRMKIESLFIDEGFGSLDIDTLSIAMDALENLQTQGRKIGVISHVEEMKERITTQVQVVKTANGRSIVKVVG